MEDSVESLERIESMCLVEMAEKRKRGHNFTREEKKRLIKLVREHKESILNKKTDGKTNEAKANAWVNVTDAFNSEGTLYRSKESLIKVWEKLKSEGKSYYAALRTEETEPCGRPDPRRIDLVLEQVCSVLWRSCTGVTSGPENDWEEVQKQPVQEDTSESYTHFMLGNSDDQSRSSGSVVDRREAREVKEASDNSDKKTPQWCRRRLLLKKKNTRASLSSSFRNVNKKRDDIKDLRQQLLIDEIEFKRKLYELQLQAAQKEVDIKTEILLRIKGGDMQMDYLFGHKTI